MKIDCERLRATLLLREVLPEDGAQVLGGATQPSSLALISSEYPPERRARTT